MSKQQCYKIIKLIQTKELLEKTMQTSWMDPKSIVRKHSKSSMGCQIVVSNDITQIIYRLVPILNHSMYVSASIWVLNVQFRDFKYAFHLLRPLINRDSPCTIQVSLDI